jgi:exonuclease VII large subunit
LGLPVPNNCTISVLGLSLPLKADSTIVASAAPTLEGQLRLRIEEETPSEEAAARQAAALNLLVTLARGFTVPLAGNNDNNSLKELLKTAAVSQKHDRVVVTATVGRSLFSDAAAGENALPKTF